MQNSIWKLTALAGVIAIGVLITIQAQSHLGQQGEEESYEVPVSSTGLDGSTGMSGTEEIDFDTIFDNQAEPTFGSVDRQRGIDLTGVGDETEQERGVIRPVGGIDETVTTETESSFESTSSPEPNRFSIDSTEVRRIPTENDSESTSSTTVSEFDRISFKERESETTVESTTTETEGTESTEIKSPFAAAPTKVEPAEESTDTEETKPFSFDDAKPLKSVETESESEETEVASPFNVLPSVTKKNEEKTDLNETVPGLFTEQSTEPETETTASASEAETINDTVVEKEPLPSEVPVESKVESETPEFTSVRSTSEETSTETESNEAPFGSSSDDGPSFDDSPKFSASETEETVESKALESDFDAERPAFEKEKPSFGEVADTTNDTESTTDETAETTETTKTPKPAAPFILDLGDGNPKKSSEATATTEEEEKKSTFGGLVDLGNSDENGSKSERVESEPKRFQDDGGFQTIGGQSDEKPTPKTDESPRSLQPVPEGLELASPKVEARSIRPVAATGNGIRKGTQLPKMKIEKQAPKSAVLGRPMIYSILVSNQGDSPAHQVVVEDVVPKGVKLIGSIPQAELTGNRLIWRMGTIPVGEEQKIAVKVIPTAQGTVGSIATVNFVAEVASKTLITAPKINLSLTAPRTSKVGELVVLHFEITNNGATAAENVVLRNLIPSNLKHPHGSDLEYPVGKLAVGETRKIKLSMNAIKPGAAVNEATVTADGGLSTTAKAKIDVDGQLIVKREGPEQRHIGRATEFTNTVTNMSGSQLRSVKVIESVPSGMEFVKASHGGRFDPALRQVSWELDALKSQEGKSVKVILVPRKAGDQKTEVKVADAFGSHAETDAVTSVVGIPSLAIDVAQPKAAVSRGDSVTLTLSIRNRGSNFDKNVAMKVTIPEQFSFNNADGPVRYSIRKDGVLFEPVANLRQGEEVSFELQLTARKAGDARLQFQVQSDHFKRPLSREEAILVYND